MSNDRNPVAVWMPAAPTDEQVRADVLAAMNDPRVSEAFKLLRVVAHGVPFETAIAAVFHKWDLLDAKDKVFALAEMMGWNLEWLGPCSLLENVAAWNCPWDDFRKPARPAGGGE